MQSVVRPRWAAVMPRIAVLAGLATLTAACGSGSPAAGSGASSPADLAVALGHFVQCMHAHGERDIFLSHGPASPPAPGSTLIVFHGFAIQGADQSSARFPAAMKTCQQLLPHGTPPDAAEQRQAFIKGLRMARCMRSHGYPGWPDPTQQGTYNMQPLPPASIDTASPRFEAAARTCGVALPPGGGG